MDVCRHCRKEATRTPDPYVPNVVRYQLRYFPFCECKGMNFFITLLASDLILLQKIVFRRTSFKTLINSESGRQSRIVQ